MTKSLLASIRFLTHVRRNELWLSQDDNGTVCIINTASGTRVPARLYVYVTLTLESFYSAVTRRHPGSNLTRAKRNLGVTLPRPGPNLAHLDVYRR
jgi:hypothetical protein